MILSARMFHTTGLRPDVVIVGAGLNGLTLATELDTGRRSILVLEAGPVGAGEAWESDVSGTAFEGAKAGRRRGLGGTGAWWAGQCAPFDPVDLEVRTWVPHSGWPISWGELAHWYPAASKVLGIPTQSFDETQWLRRGLTVPQADALPHKFSVFLPQPDLAKTLRKRLEASSKVTVLVDAQVTGVFRHPTSQRVGGVEIHSGRGERTRIHSPVVVLAAGGIETPRILLLSADADGQGLGNRNGNVGKYLHDHPSAITAQVFPADATSFRNLYGMMYEPKSLSSTRSWARIYLSAASQKRYGVVSATANLVFEDRKGSIEDLKNLVRMTRNRAAAGESRGSSFIKTSALAAKALPLVPHVAWRRFANGLSPNFRNSTVWLRTASEQPPREECRITLSKNGDANGIPRAEVHWVLGAEELAAQKALVTEISAHWERSGTASLSALPWVYEEGDGWKEHQADAYHHSGTLRMSASAVEGVVNGDLESHEVPGLYVVGSSVFPTSSNSNPTYTSIALTLRLARHLIDRGAV